MFCNIFCKTRIFSFKVLKLEFDMELDVSGVPDEYDLLPSDYPTASEMTADEKEEDQLAGKAISSESLPVVEESTAARDEQNVPVIPLTEDPLMMLIYFLILLAEEILIMLFYLLSLAEFVEVVWKNILTFFGTLKCNKSVFIH